MQKIGGERPYISLTYISVKLRRKLSSLPLPRKQRSGGLSWLNTAYQPRTVFVTTPRWVTEMRNLLFFQRRTQEGTVCVGFWLRHPSCKAMRNSKGMLVQVTKMPSQVISWTREMCQQLRNESQVAWKIEIIRRKRERDPFKSPSLTSAKSRGRR